MVTSRRVEEIENLAIAKKTKDAETVDLVNHLEALSAEVVRVRELRTSLTSQCKEQSSRHE